MNKAYTIIHSLDEFQAAREQFGYVVNKLQSEETSELEHGDVEAMIDKDGKEILRRLLQGYLDLRANREERRDQVIGVDGVERNRCREENQTDLMSLFGDVKVTRKGYWQKAAACLFPLDAQLNLSPDKYSDGMRRRVVDEVAKNSFDEAVTSIGKTTGGKVPKRQAEELAVDISQDFVDFYEARKAQEPEATDDPLIMSMDGKGIVMLKEALREATRKAAERSKHKLQSRLSPGEKKNRKRMAMVGTVYSVAKHIRTAEEIMNLEERQSTPPRARNKRVWASVERDHEVVCEEVFQEALRRDPEKRRTWVMLVDGHEDQLRHIHAYIRRHKVQVVLILDFIHVLEYLWKAAYCFHAKGSEEAEQWVAERALQILKGSSSHVAAGMRRSATLRKLKKPRRKAVDKCANYLLGYRDMLKYDEYLAQRLPIATGVIEGACRHLINDRMDITGARWGLQRAEAVLKLRSLRSSGDFDAYWEYHKSQALRRNHIEKYERFPFNEAA